MTLARTDWTRYGPCRRDGAVAGQPCTTRRMAAGEMVNDPMHIPHVDRPKLVSDDPIAEDCRWAGREVDGLAAVVAVLECLRPDERIRVLRYAVDKYGPNELRGLL